MREENGEANTMRREGGREKREETGKPLKDGCVGPPER
jgi:hypothetical protein